MYHATLQFRALTHTLTRTLNAVADTAVRIRYQLPHHRSKQVFVEKQRSARFVREQHGPVLPREIPTLKVDSVQLVRTGAITGAGCGRSGRKSRDEETSFSSERNVPEADTALFLYPGGSVRRNSLLDFDYQENSIPIPGPGPESLGFPRRETCVTCRASRAGRESHRKPR